MTWPLTPFAASSTIPHLALCVSGVFQVFQTLPYIGPSI